MTLQDGFEMRCSLLLAAFALALGGCNDPNCRPGEIKIGKTCEDLPERLPDAGEGDLATGESPVRQDAAVGTGFDASTEMPGLVSDATVADATNESFDSSLPTETDADAQAVPDGSAANPVDAGPACVPGAEVCDGKDNDCDGQIDESVSESPIGTACSNGGQGACAKPGTHVCVDGRVICSAPPATPSTEVCDGVDNDCDGRVDEDVSEAPIGMNCSNGAQGVCAKTGKQQCVAGKISCDAARGTPGTEVCDGLDNDCDGMVDEGASEAPIGGDCSNGALGLCAKPGKNVCSAGKITCNASTGVPSTEVCDNLDNDCDGQVDEGVSEPPLGAACSNGTGSCRRTGTQTCRQGAIECDAVPAAPVDICPPSRDGVDNDCDGNTDESQYDGTVPFTEFC